MTTPIIVSNGNGEYWRTEDIFADNIVWQRFEPTEEEKRAYAQAPVIDFTPALDEIHRDMMQVLFDD